MGMVVSYLLNKMHLAKPEHVLVLAKYEGKWLLTEHPSRGIEFPGGIVIRWRNIRRTEREVMEETVKHITEMGIYWLATYMAQENIPFTKGVFDTRFKY